MHGELIPDPARPGRRRRRRLYYLEREGGAVLPNSIALRGGILSTNRLISRCVFRYKFQTPRIWVWGAAPCLNPLSLEFVPKQMTRSEVHLLASFYPNAISFGSTTPKTPHMYTEYTLVELSLTSRSGCPLETSRKVDQTVTPSSQTDSGSPASPETDPRLSHRVTNVSRTR